MNMKLCVWLLLPLGMLGNGDTTLSDSSCSSEEPVCDQKSSAAESSLWRGSKESVQHQEENETKGTFSGDKQTPDTLRIAVVGKTGSGKSSTANTILGRKEFEAKLSSTSVTKNCSKAESDVDGRRVAVVDTPGLFDTTISNENTIIETFKSISLLAPGPHAFLLLIPIGRFTEEERRAVEYIKKSFGEEAKKYIMVLFTRGDELLDEGTSIDDYIKNADPALKELISDCGNRLHVFNNKEKKDRSQVKELLKKIDHMVKENGGRYYTSLMLQAAEEAIRKEVARILKEKEEEMRREREEIERKYQEKMEKVLEMERQRQEEEKQEMEKQFRGREEEMRRETEMQRRREEELKEMERRREEEKEEMKKRHEQEARRKAEQSNSFLDKALAFVANEMKKVMNFVSGSDVFEKLLQIIIAAARK